MVLVLKRDIVVALLKVKLGTQSPKEQSNWITLKKKRKREIHCLTLQNEANGSETANYEKTIKLLIMWLFFYYYLVFHTPLN